MGTIPSYPNLSSLTGIEEFVCDDAGTTKNATSYLLTDNQYTAKDVAGGIDVVLTAAEAYNKRLKFTGIITADINVTIPDNTERLYVVENGTTGAFTLTFKTVSGTGVLVGRGGSVLASSDGTNIDTPDTERAGVVKLWSGAIADIPAGYNLCDGSNGTPDLTDRFVLHADADSGGTNDVNDTGGANTHIHTMGTHHHSITHTHSVPRTGWGSVASSVDGILRTGSGSSVTGASANNTSGGSSAANTGSIDPGDTNSGSNIPKFYALAYIMKL